MRTPSHYQILGIPPDASRRTVRSAYRKALRRYHPDANRGDRSGEAMLHRILAAGQTLGDPRRRAEYDRGLEKPLGAHQEPSTSSRQLNGPRLQKLIAASRRILRHFFSRDLARVVESRARNSRPRQQSFEGHLFRAISRNRANAYRLDPDGVYRRPDMGSRREWLRRTTVSLLGGFLFWMVWRG